MAHLLFPYEFSFKINQICVAVVKFNFVTLITILIVLNLGFSQGTSFSSLVFEINYMIMSYQIVTIEA